MLGDIPVLKIGEFTIRLMTKEDAPGVVALYRAIYGEHYPIKEMYDPEFIYNQQEKGLMVRAVAVDASGLVVGSQAIYRLEEAYPGLYESGHGMVLPPYRGHSFSNRFLELLFCQVGPAMGIEQFWGEAVTNHVFMQKAGLAMPGISETGIELEIMPAGAYETERSATGRVSTVVMVNPPHKDKPQDIFLPAPYGELMRDIYGRTPMQRHLREADAPLPSGATTRLTHTYIAGAEVLRITIWEAGEDLEEQVSTLVRQYEGVGAAVFQVFFPLGKAYSGAITEVLNRLGFFFGAVLPRWFDEDGLLMQKLAYSPDYDRIQLYSDFAKKILAFIREDRNRVT